MTTIYLRTPATDDTPAGELQRAAATAVGGFGTDFAEAVAKAGLEYPVEVLVPPSRARETFHTLWLVTGTSRHRLGAYRSPEDLLEGERRDLPFRELLLALHMDVADPTGMWICGETQEPAFLWRNTRTAGLTTAGVHVEVTANGALVSTAAKHALDFDHDGGQVEVQGAGQYSLRGLAPGDVPAAVCALLGFLS